MKKTLLLLLAVLGSAFAKAQSPEDCNQMLSIFAENAKAKLYDEAYKQLQQLEERCPDASLAIYQYGERIYRHRLSKKIGDQNENALGLIRMLDTEIAKFADKVNTTRKEVDKVNVMYKYAIGTRDEQFEILKKDLEKDPENFTDPKALITYFKLAEERYKKGKISLQELFDIYDNLTGHVETIQNDRSKTVSELLIKEEDGTIGEKENIDLKNQEKNLKNYNVVMGSINKTLGTLADCDQLVPLYNKEFEQNATDAAWLSNVLRRLQKKECTTDDLYIKSVKALHALNPSAKTAYGLGNIADTTTERFKYWDQAIELGVDDDYKSIIYYKKGNEYMKKGQYSSAKREFLLSNKAKPSFGMPFIKIAQMIAKSGGQCGKTPFEKRAVNWIAAKYAARAGKVDASLRSTAQKYVASYLGTAPTNEVFMNQDYNSGDTITFNCWIGESVRIP
ncbi:MAG: hypothetical protein WBA16_02365 [Nonlabens sp.]